MSEPEGDDQPDLLARDIDLAWELYAAQPTHPEIPGIIARVLAQQPWRSGMRILLAQHLHACGEIDKARQELYGVLGRRDLQFVNAARELRDIELADSNYAEALRWAEIVLREDSEDWLDWMELGGAMALAGAPEDGWQQMDEAVEMCARTDADRLPGALVHRAIYLLQSYAPPERLVPAAEEAIRADPSDEFISIPLIFAYVHQGRFDDGEQLALRLLRQDPTDGLAEGALEMIRKVKSTIEREGLSLDDLHQVGLLGRLWNDFRDQRLGFDLTAALAALERVLPDELRAGLLPPAPEEVAEESQGFSEIAAWHDGQLPGTGAAWGLDGNFRLMSAAEIKAMDDAIEAEPEAYPDWKSDRITEFYTQLMTDDAGSYVIETATGTLAIRRPGRPDEEIAASMADWFWGRVVAFGGRDPRPVSRPQPV